VAIPDLLWACPACGEDRGLAARGRACRCTRCGTAFRRGPGAAIRADGPDGSTTVLQPAEWLARLPEPRSLVRQRDGEGGTIRAARASTRRVSGSDAVFDEHGYLNRIELWGEPAPGRLELRPDQLVWSPDDGASEAWPLGELTAVQASSRAVQLNRAGALLVEVRFDDDSVFLWERLLHAALRDFYGRMGRGEIVEFQPRIVTA
jgi:hypothetical protein